MNDNHKTVDVLLRFGGDVHSRNTKKWTPLGIILVYTFLELIGTYYRITQN